ncbi:hypothetical protein RJ55_02714 [Drechmeria coniospora]|nr:hypothetical protein RJ55_02714 [Drechmeria coniospora]
MICFWSRGTQSCARQPWRLGHDSDGRRRIIVNRSIQHDSREAIVARWHGFKSTEPDLCMSQYVENKNGFPVLPRPRVLQPSSTLTCKQNDADDAVLATGFHVISRASAYCWSRTLRCNDDLAGCLLDSSSFTVGPYRVQLVALHLRPGWSELRIVISVQWSSTTLEVCQGD